MQSKISVQPSRHFLELLPMLAPPVLSEVCQIVMNHLMNHNVYELLLCKVIIVCHQNDGIIERLVEPTTCRILEVATRSKGM